MVPGFGINEFLIGAAIVCVVLDYGPGILRELLLDFFDWCDGKENK